MLCAPLGNDVNSNTTIIQNMDAFDSILLLLYCKGDAHIGRIALQKLAYIAGCKIPTLEMPPYKLQYYGPFSEELGRILERLVSTSFVSENMTPGIYYESYDYSLNDDGVDISNDLKNRPEYMMIGSFMNVCRETCNFDVAALSYASKILYLMVDRSYDEAVLDAGESDWGLYRGDTQMGIEMLQRLNLVHV
ncbi:MAG: hypothetical protein F4Y82_05405 [Cenarchaeum sp. SB0665_bin_23]|nr:hypothetical protein [Cenarchaeum sp. SB0667_bin_13]MXY61528.1 hypothetical protein [Cenarchaeum sp. SB0665_bin_23]MXZ93087.1 hypothetical protein [Cenarchaeum sp. SB0666_bin_15]MYB47602.1 hypothetical protein [Cenarchaeum sp. SB0662_bin_33]MYC79255.1 hypothetical protein [Cenarchaeum sp. SB0661_bin_35]MYD59182.1 hypothetical protein [Cenarchaeum sp. SB0678_bin_8]MYG33678.1 hypothetical protein [Cenarchaeum sp. SB0677_bin_16]MYI51467.1 hypothetical protein [Cenarchaeum sp. SB0673_bin_9]M